jgi:alkanesulfonate monooxygenase SsuD/methylene tetrahydromethanopterin reductase-like flavin-dependent oxidoreductase (luciferase family)
VSPQPEREIPLWVAVGGTPASVVRAAHLGLPMALAIIGGSYRQFARFADLYRKAAAQFGHDVGTLKLSINSPGFLSRRNRPGAALVEPPHCVRSSRANSTSDDPERTRLTRADDVQRRGWPAAGMRWA